MRKSELVSCRPALTKRGVSPSSRHVGRGMRWTWAGVRWQHRRDIGSRTAKSCGPGAATVASIRSACAGLATVTTNAAHRGEHEGNRKTIARGRPGCPGCTCGLTRVRSRLLRCTRDCGRSRRPVFPAPSDRRGSNETAKPGQNESRERERMLTPRRQVDMNHPCGSND